MRVNPRSLDIIRLSQHLIFIQSRCSKCQVINIFIISQTSLEDKATIESQAGEFLHPLDTHIRHQHCKVLSLSLSRYRFFNNTILFSSSRLYKYVRRRRCNRQAGGRRRASESRRGLVECTTSGARDR